MTREESLAALLRKITQVVAAGVDWVQIREKDLSARELASLTREALEIALRPSHHTRATRILVNDRLDVAIAEHAGGIHLGENSLPIQEAKRLIQSAELKHAINEDFPAGVSCHSFEGAQAAESSGADYIFFGPVFATPSKSAFGEPQGAQRLAQVCRAVSIPVIAIGGITGENAAACHHAGAAGIAAIRLFQDANDGSEIVESIRRVISAA